MPRGRKKDLTTPPSRALAHQRNYRARRAQYVADLETRCRTAEEEVVRLRAELAHARGETAGGDEGGKEEERARAELDVMCRELVRHLATTAAAVERFQTRVGGGGQSRARDEAPTASSPPPSTSNTSNLDLLVTAILSTSPPAARSDPRALQEDASSAAGEDEEMDPSDARCCGGFLDCRDLVVG